MINVRFIYWQEKPKPVEVGIAEVMLPESPRVGDMVLVQNDSWRVMGRTWLIGPGAPHRMVAWVEPIKPTPTEVTKV